MSTNREQSYTRNRHRRAYLDEFGHEKLDATPMAPPVGYVKAPSLVERIREMIRSERLAMEAAQQGFETFEEADDFDVGDDFDPRSPYEEYFDPTPLPELRRRQQAAQAESGQEGARKPQPERSEGPGEHDPLDGSERPTLNKAAADTSAALAKPKS